MRRANKSPSNDAQELSTFADDSSAMFDVSCSEDNNNEMPGSEHDGYADEEEEEEEEINSQRST